MLGAAVLLMYLVKLRGWKSLMWVSKCQKTGVDGIGMSLFGANR
jgi:hypothetical protein